MKRSYSFSRCLLVLHLIKPVEPFIVPPKRLSDPAININFSLDDQKRYIGYQRQKSLVLSNNADDEDGTTTSTTNRNFQKMKESSLLEDPRRNLSFSGLMILCGALLGPFLGSYYSDFGVLQYDNPIMKLQLWGTAENPALITSWCVPEFFGLAGFIIGWLYIILDYKLLPPSKNLKEVTAPWILMGISVFTAQYWFGGALFAGEINRTVILNIMTVVATIGFYILDGTISGFYTSLATAIAGPLIEVGLLSFLRDGGYHYNINSGFFPLWIFPVYFLGGTAYGNLARGFWNLLSSTETTERNDAKQTRKKPPGCKVCNDSRCVCCPNCDCQGYYVTYGRSVKCNACKGRGLVICRACFSYYDEDPADIESIRKLMSQMPD